MKLPMALIKQLNRKGYGVTELQKAYIFEAYAGGEMFSFVVPEQRSLAGYCNFLFAMGHNFDRSREAYCRLDQNGRGADGKDMKEVYEDMVKREKSIFGAFEIIKNYQVNHKEGNLGDGCKIIVPDKPIDCSMLGYFDEMEAACWALVKTYCDHLGIEIVCEGESNTNCGLVERIQEEILDELTLAGANLMF